MTDRFILHNGKTHKQMQEYIPIILEGSNIK
jgi:hypothetical protein